LRCRSFHRPDETWERLTACFRSGVKQLIEDEISFDAAMTLH